MKKLIILMLSSILAFQGVYAETRSADYHGAGPRLGLTVDPDQFHFGGHIDFGDIASNLMMLPNLEISVGDDLTIIAPTFELDYRFGSNWGRFTPYLGGGVGPIFYSHDSGRDDSELGLYVQGGIMKQLSRMNPGRFFLEFKLGLADSPDARFTVGWIFGR